jgi:hypothetical protein
MANLHRIILKDVINISTLVEKQIEGLGMSIYLKTSIILAAAHNDVKICSKIRNHDQ